MSLAIRSAAGRWWRAAKAALLNRFPVLAVMLDTNAGGVACAAPDGAAIRFRDWCTNCACQTTRCKQVSFGGLTQATDGPATNAPENTLWSLAFSEGDLSPADWVIRYTDPGNPESTCTWSRISLAPPEYCISAIGGSTVNTPGNEVGNVVTERFTYQDGVYYRYLMWTVGRVILFYGWDSSETPWDCSEEFEYTNLITGSLDQSVVTPYEDFQPDPENPVPIADDGIFLVGAYGGTVTVTPAACPCIDCFNSGCSGLRFILTYTQASTPITVYVDVQPIGDLTQALVTFSNPDDPDMLVQMVGSFTLEGADGSCEWVLKIAPSEYVRIDGPGDSVAFGGLNVWCCPLVIRQTFAGCPVSGLGNWSVDDLSDTGDCGEVDYSFELEDVVDLPGGEVPPPTCPEACNSCGNFAKAFVTTDYGAFEFCLIRDGCMWASAPSAFGSVLLVCVGRRWYAIVDVTDGANETTIVFGMIPDDGDPTSCPLNDVSHEWELVSKSGSTTETTILSTASTADCGDCDLCNATDPEQPVNCNEKPRIQMSDSSWSDAASEFPGCVPTPTGRGDFVITPLDAENNVDCGGEALGVAVGNDGNPCALAGVDVAVNFVCQTTAFNPAKHWVATIEYSDRVSTLSGTVVYEDNGAAKCYSNSIFQLVSNTVPNFTPGAFNVT